ncbi:hypothetical protein HY251_13190 [bacterium]|nr:hypothetical protein [bacterium]
MGNDYVDPNGPAQGGAPPKKGMSWILILAIVAVGCLGLVCVVGIVAAIAIPNLISARQRGNEMAAIGSLKTISTMEMLFKEGDKDQNGKLDYGTLAQLGETGLVDTVLAGGVKQGYFFTCQPGTDPEKVFWAMARPALPGTTGSRVFYTNQDGFVFYIQVGRDAKDVPVPDPTTGAPPEGAVRLGQ